MIGTDAKPDCICLRDGDPFAARVMVPGESIDRRSCCGCGRPVLITEDTAHWERDVIRCHRRTPRYGCDECFHADGTRRETR